MNKQKNMMYTPRWLAPARMQGNVSQVCNTATKMKQKKQNKLIKNGQTKQKTKAIN